MIFLKISSEFNEYALDFLSSPPDSYLYIKKTTEIQNIIIVAQKDKNFPTEFLAVFQNDEKFDEWYSNLSQKTNVTILDKNIFAIYADSYIPVCPLSVENNSYRSIMEFILKMEARISKK